MFDPEPRNTIGRLPAGIRTALVTLEGTLTAPVAASGIALFRVLFGLVVIWWVARYFAFEQIEYLYVIPRFHFKYEPFTFLRPWPGLGMYLHFGLTAAAALCLALGLWTRTAATLLWLLYTYIFLLDKTPYQNHYYLISLLALLLSVVRCGDCFSLDVRLGLRPAQQFVEAWQLWVLRIQVLTIYFFAGVAKLNTDWLSGQPLHSWLQQHAQVPWVGHLLADHRTAVAFSLAGLVFDLCIGPLLCLRPTRALAFLAVASFHLINRLLFDIGVFHWLMLATLVLFVDPDAVARVMGSGARARSLPAARGRKTVTVLVAAYCFIQLMVPLRHWAIPGNVAWTESGRSFAWQVKARDKPAFGEFRIRDGELGTDEQVNPYGWLTELQVMEMFRRPDMIAQFARFLRDSYLARGWAEPQVRADVCASLNGRPFQPLVDPHVDLAHAPEPWWGTPAWVMPLWEDTPLPELASRARDLSFCAALVRRHTAN